MSSKKRRKKTPTKRKLTKARSPSRPGRKKQSRKKERSRSPSRPDRKKKQVRRKERARAREYKKRLKRSIAAKKAAKTRAQKQLTEKQRRRLAAQKAARTRALKKRLAEERKREISEARRRAIEARKLKPPKRKPPKRKPPKRKPPKVKPKTRIIKKEIEGSTFINVEGESLNWLVRFVDLLRQAGVKWFRFVRKVPASPKYPRGTASTNWRPDVANMTLGQLEGYLGSMLVPGVEELIEIVVPTEQLPKGFLD